MIRAEFFSAVRASLFGGSLTPGQVLGMEAILDEWDHRRLTDIRWLAYFLATALGEVGKGMQPVREGFKHTDAEARAYVKAKGYKYAVEKGGHVYYGRGLTQNTWLDNYTKLTKLAVAQGYAVDFVANPDLFLDTRWAVWSMFEGMIGGLFTGKKLIDYFNAAATDWRNARRIINGLDRADEIAGYGKAFHVALLRATAGEVPATPVPVPPPVLPPQRAPVAVVVASGGILVLLASFWDKISAFFHSFF